MRRYLPVSFVVCLVVFVSGLGLATATAQDVVVQPPVVVTPGDVPGGAATAIPAAPVQVAPIYLDNMYPAGPLTPTPMTDPFGPLPLTGACGPACGGTCGATCGPTCGPACQATTGCRACPCGPRSRLWARGEFLLWWTRGMRIPHLITTSPGTTDASDAGVLFEEGTRTLYGNTKILEDTRPGGRIILGGWFDCCQHLGAEFEWFGLQNDSDRFSVQSDGTGSPILARPFFNINPRDPFSEEFDPPARQDSELVAYPGILDGRVFAVSSTSLKGTGIRFRYNLCCCQAPGRNVCGCRTPGPWSRLDLLVGYRYMRLKDRLRVTEDLNSLDLALPGEFNISDSFDSRNVFNGLDLGMIWESHWNRLSLELLGKVAFGNTRQIIDVNGRTVTSIDGLVLRDRGGILALQSNLGRHTNDDFSVVPEIGITAGYRVTRNLRATFGYSLLYWSQVARAGDQVDLDVNPDLWPEPADPVTGALRPQFVFNTTHFWAQGLNFGLDWHW